MTISRRDIVELGAGASLSLALSLALGGCGPGEGGAAVGAARGRVPGPELCREMERFVDGL